MAEKEQMQPFWYQGYLIDPNEELPFSPGQLEAENAGMICGGYGQKRNRMHISEQSFGRQINKRQERKRTFERVFFFAPILKGGSKNETISEPNPDCGFFINDRKYQKRK
mgnify:CR=1 FL=1